MQRCMDKHSCFVQAKKWCKEWCDVAQAFPISEAMPMINIVGRPADLERAEHEILQKKIGACPAQHLQFLVAITIATLQTPLGHMCLNRQVSLNSAFESFFDASLDAPCIAYDVQHILSAHIHAENCANYPRMNESTSREKKV
eukprot:1162143-Pelagomonas_calceolata.AAC.23